MFDWLHDEYVAWINKGCPINSKVKLLDLSGSQLTTIPAEIKNLCNLETLDLSYNQLTEVPAEIGTLHKLEELYLNSNKLTEVPAEIGNLHKLNKLELNDNQLTKIPAEIGNIHNIYKINLSDNQLTTIPAEICNTQIDVIYINNNPIEYLPPNVILHFEKQHNAAIQYSIKEYIMHLISIPPIISSEYIIESILSDYNLTNFTKQSLVDYSKNTDLINGINVTFLDILTAVWNLIVNSEHATDIKTALNDEMADSECKCVSCMIYKLVKFIIDV